MSKQVLIISTSPRKGGNSDTLAEEFLRGAREAGHEAEKITLYDKTIGFCRGCLTCQTTQRCVIHDDADAIAQKMLTADVIVFATPIYYYGMSGQMKTLLDRANPLYSADYAFREVWLLACAAEEGDEVWKRAAEGLGGWVECFPKAKLAGVVFGGGVTAPGEVRGSEAMQRALDAGRAL